MKKNKAALVCNVETGESYYGYKTLKEALLC